MGLMRDEALTSLSPAPGQDLAAYTDALMARFERPASLIGNSVRFDRCAELVPVNGRTARNCSSTGASISARPR